MMFVWRNDDALWPNGHILAIGEDLADARNDARASVDYPQAVKDRISAEEPIRVFEDAL